MELVVKAIVNPTEDVDKVKAAILNLVDVKLALEQDGDQTYITGRSTSLFSLSPLRNLISRTGMGRLVREVLRSNTVGDTIEIKLHKQAAYVGALSFVSQDGESPMGPITITITAAIPDKIIDWLAPQRRGSNGLHG